VAAAIGLAGTGLRQTGGDLLRRAEIALGDDPGLAVDPGGLGQVVVGLPVLLLADDEMPYLGTTTTAGKSRASELIKRAGQRCLLKEFLERREITSTGYPGNLR